MYKNIVDTESLGRIKQIIIIKLKNLEMIVILIRLFINLILWFYNLPIFNLFKFKLWIRVKELKFTLELDLIKENSAVLLSTKKRINAIFLFQKMPNKVWLIIIKNIIHLLLIDFFQCPQNKKKYLRG